MEDSPFVDDNEWMLYYPENMTRWIANLVKLTDFKWTILDILETERRYPRLIDDVLTQLGYQNALKRENKDA